MIPPNGRGSRSRGTFLLADVSGSTGFLNGVAAARRALILDADEPPAAYAVLTRGLVPGGRVAAAATGARLP